MGQPLAFGFESFTNHGRMTVVLDRIALLHPRHERVVGAYAVPGTLYIGVGYWPPRYKIAPYSWKHRHPLPGFRLAPGKSFNLILGLVATSAGTVSSRGLMIYYHDSAGRYVTGNRYALLITANKRGC